MKKIQLHKKYLSHSNKSEKVFNFFGKGYVAIITLLIGLLLGVFPQQISGQQCKKVFTYTTAADQTFTVPAGITSITIKAWGAGGGGGNSVYYAPVSGGAGGGYSTGTLAVNPGDVLTIRVGKGGVTGSTVATFGGGGAGGTATQNGGSGGGLAGVFIGSTPVLIAGGGGGGSPGADTVSPIAGGGGGTTGGGSPVAAYMGGKGGTQTAGGAAGNGGNNGTDGSFLTGGKGGNGGSSSNEGGGGGGGGYYGGGGGAGQGPNYNGPGGGGSSYVGYSALTATSTIAGGNGAFNSVAGAAGNNTDTDYAVGVGNGLGTGGVGTAGGNGRVVIIFSRTITGNNVICRGTTSQLTVSPSVGAGETWVSSNTAVATVNSTGLVTGVAAGTATITYTDSGVCTVPFAITVPATTAITAQPITTQTVLQNAAPTNLSVTAAGAALTYQWYSNTTNSNTGGTAITGATSSTYTPPTNVLGTTYYYAVVTGTCGVVTSNTSAVIVYTLTSDLEVTKSVNIATSTVGSNVTFTIIAKNNGPDNNTNVVVNDLLPSGFTYVSHIATGTTYVPGTGIWTVGTLANAATRTLSVVAKITAAGNYTNTAVITTTSGIADPNTINNTASATENVTDGVCYNNANTTAAGVDVIHGITTLQRAGTDNGNWPMIRKSAHTVLESNTKGFVITRMTTTQINTIVSPQEGMMVYDTVAKCLKINSDSTTTGWSCFNLAACP